MSTGGYTRIREIGSGGFGKAILVHDAEGKQFVLKAIDISRMDSKERKDAVNEVRVLSSLKHPYVVSYRESFLDGRTLCIVMDYAEGGDLFNRIAMTRKAGQAFPEPQILRWFTQASLALKHIHEKHVLHRDLKSQNLFITAGGRLRIGDFGIAKVLDNTGAFAKTRIGTPYYLSPEICQERPYSWSSDIWALGCILYEMGALRVPFDAPNIRALVTKITRGPTPALPSRFSLELQRLCGEMLQREEKRRPSSSEVLKYPIVQIEIRGMLMEEQQKRSEQCPGRGHGPPGSGGNGAVVTPAGGANGCCVAARHGAGAIVRESSQQRVRTASSPEVASRAPSAQPPPAPVDGVRVPTPIHGDA
eukprot:TRINITY_DN33146_c0_g1_i1.p1 TRINITY_DN33146_c0_g1~~TRINITY_DN33146_c0_g1_i1.p1  ORF type:complete len:362 (-),score=56.99 TRINITY_DN33146_c0_g1_i1:220-1305(-)